MLAIVFSSFGGTTAKPVEQVSPKQQLVVNVQDAPFELQEFGPQVPPFSQYKPEQQEPPSHDWPGVPHPPASGPPSVGGPPESQQLARYMPQLS
jgi:hypothetical protein